MAADDGITHIACTPHANGYYDVHPEGSPARSPSCKTCSSNAKIPITLGRGCDFHMSYDNIQRPTNEPTRFSFNGVAISWSRSPTMLFRLLSTRSSTRCRSPG